MYFPLVFIIYFFHESSYQWTEFLTKPLSLGILIVFLLTAKVSLPIELKKGILFGILSLAFSDLSFLLRMFVSDWFVVGTILFSLLAIFMFSKGFQFTKNSFLPVLDFKSITPINLFLSILIIVFPISIFIIEDLETWQYPAIFYQLLLWVLISQSLKRQDLVNETSYYLVLFGAFGYTTTTMLITLQHFTDSTFDFHSFPVISYFTSIYLIVVGAVRQGYEPEAN